MGTKGTRGFDGDNEGSSPSEQTRQLRRLLDKRGSLYEKPEADTTIFYDEEGNKFTYNVNPESGWAQLFGYRLTPEKAFLATLGDPCEEEAE